MAACGCARRGDGKLLWIYNVGSPVPFQPAVAGGSVYFGTEDGCIYCIRTGDPAARGWAMWGGGAGHNGGKSSAPARDHDEPGTVRQERGS